MTSTNYAVLVEEIQKHRLALMELGAMLKHAKENQIWLSEIGEGVNTWFDFLAQPEIGLTPAQANFYIRLYEYADRVGLGEMSRVPEGTAKVLVTTDIPIDILEAQTLTTRDFKERYYDRKTNERGKRTYTYMVMKKCLETGNMSKVHGIEPDEILTALGDKIENE